MGIGKIIGSVAGAISGNKQAKTDRKVANANIASQRLRDDAFRAANSMASTAANRSAAQAVAGFNPYQTDAFAKVAENYGQGFDDLDTAVDNARGYTGGVRPQDVEAWMNPYMQQVLDATMGDIDLMRRRRLGDLSSDAENAKAFGGDRFAVQAALENESFDRNSFNTAANLRYTGYGDAVNNAMRNQDFKMSGNEQLARMIAARRGATAQDTAALMGVGDQIQAQDQAERDWAIKAAQLMSGVLAQDKGASVVPNSGGRDPIASALAGMQAGANIGQNVEDLFGIFRRQPDYRTGALDAPVSAEGMNA